MNGHVTIWKDDQGLRHWLDDEGYCLPHAHFVAHQPESHLRHTANCEGVDHPGRTCDEVAYDTAEAE